jgi:cobalt-zinc-cadmium efflux system membrane fusion protein
MHDLQPIATVPGEITYDATRRLPVAAPVSGIVADVLVEPGQPIAAGQPLAVLSSAEVGMARDNVLARQAEVALAQKEQAWADQVATNVNSLVATLSQRPKLAELERDLDQQMLGEYRETVLGAYSKLVLAEQLLGSVDSLHDTGAVSRRSIDERRSNREVAAALFRSTCETAQRETARHRDKTRALAEQAERLLAVAQQELANLLGPAADMSPVTDREKLSQLVLLSPLAGRLAERQAVKAARVTAGAPLFTVADNSQLWVSAEIHERDWPALDVAQQGSVAVRIPALGGDKRPAEVRFIGSQVAADSRSVPLVAELANADGRLKPGLFVWVEVPLAQSRPALTVPAGAVMRHENQPFVFVPAGTGEYRRVDVRTGRESQGMVEIVTGLRPGDQVVDGGAFFLKSELLLEREE